jgi:type VI secretion system protein ImpC
VRKLDMADGRVHLELLDCRADEILANVSTTGGDASRSALLAALEGDGRRCTLLVSLEEFGSSVAELSLLGGLAALAATQGAVLLAGAAPTLVGVATSADPTVCSAPEACAWRAVRESALAANVGLTFPRLLARLPYGPRNEPVAAFPFDELESPSSMSPHDQLLWRSAALDAALLLAEGDAHAATDADVESRTELDDLPAFVDRNGEDPQLQAVAEAYLGERDLGTLQAAGFIALQSDRRVPRARVAGWQSIAAPRAALAGRWR